jgi:hypothetical protein
MLIIEIIEEEEEKEEEKLTEKLELLPTHGGESLPGGRLPPQLSS